VQLVGCLIREPSLFHQTLADGQSLVEVIGPDLLGDPPLARLYQWLIRRLSDAPHGTLASLLADLQAAGEHDLVPLATDAEAQVDGLTDGGTEKVAALLKDVAATLGAAQRDQQYSSLQQSRVSTDASDEILTAAWQQNRARSGAVPRRMPRPLP
jgi:hypothetical protein